MFNLETEVHQWCRKVTPGIFFRGLQIAELEDHIHCAIAELMKRGASVEGAFQSATEEFGGLDALRKEYRKNTGMVLNAAVRISHRLAGCCKTILNHPTVKRQYITASLCLVVIFVLGVTLRNEAFAQWGKARSSLYG